MGRPTFAWRSLQLRCPVDPIRTPLPLRPRSLQHEACEARLPGRSRRTKLCARPETGAARRWRRGSPSEMHIRDPVAFATREARGERLVGEVDFTSLDQPTTTVREQLHIDHAVEVSVDLAGRHGHGAATRTRGTRLCASQTCSWTAVTGCGQRPRAPHWVWMSSLPHADCKTNSRSSEHSAIRARPSNAA